MGYDVVVREWNPRRMIEYQQIEEIEARGTGWDSDRLEQTVLDKDCWVLTAAETANNSIVGYIAFLIRPRHVRIANVGVYPTWRGVGVGRALVESVVDSYRQMQHGVIVVVDERQLAAQQFFRACRFWWTDSVYDVDEDADQYIMRWRAKPPVVRPRCANRITQHMGEIS